MIRDNRMDLLQNTPSAMMLPGKGRLVTLFTLLGFLFTVNLVPLPLQAQMTSNSLKPVSGRPVNVSGILPSDVFSRAVLLKKELEEIRIEMGKPKDEWVGGIAIECIPPRSLLPGPEFVPQG